MERGSRRWRPRSVPFGAARPGSPLGRRSAPRSSSSRCSSSVEAAPLEPSDAADRIPRLLAEAETLGLEVDASIPDPLDLAGLSPGVRVTLCATVREALMNVARYAGPTRVDVRIDTGAEQLSVVVRNRAPTKGWAPSHGAGVGIVGLRERVALLGGSLQAGPRGNGFELSATMPLGEAP